MKKYLQHVSFLQMSAASDLQTCYTQCLQTTSATATVINVMFVDGSTNPFWQGTQMFDDSKTAEFNALFPAISVELSHVPYEDMVTQAEEDLQHGTNQYHANLVPLLNTNGGTSRLADGLMDMSVFTVDITVVTSSRRTG